MDSMHCSSRDFIRTPSWISYGRTETEYVYEKVGEIISSEEELEKYGMEAKHLFYWPKMLAFGGGISVVCFGMVILCIKYTKGQDQRIREMERYCEEILDGNETLDLRDNEEGQFSILKNKVHDITMMLSGTKSESGAE